ncbi:MAG: hypothetical protein IT288_00600 [Bdellovibrionales bacterium]|nr:hypothetical protein [Bdellovibrionales bacterium]
MLQRCVTFFVILAAIPALSQENPLALEALPKVNVSDLLASSELVESGQAQLKLCFSNADFKANVDGGLHVAIERIARAHPEAITDLTNEVCVDPQLATKSRPEVDQLIARLGSLDDVNIELIKPVNSSPTELSSTDSLSARLLSPQRPIGPRLEAEAIGRHVLLTIRAATIGAAGAMLVQQARPALDYLSNKGKPGDISVGKGAAIGMITDAIQRLSGETDETKIAQRNFGASLVGSMIQTRDPNVIGLAIILTLSQVPAVQRGIDRLGEATPAHLNWKIPATMVAAFYVIGRHRAGEDWRLSKDKTLQAGTFGALAAVVSATHQGHETAGFVVASAASLLDELCDAATKKCQGRFSLADLAYNTVGAYIGAKIGGLVISPGRNRLKLHYYKEFSL